MKKIYFLCTGNSCRSQMAEGYGKKYLPSDQFEIKSAGIEAHGLNPLAVRVMAEDGVDISGQSSNLIEERFFQEADLFVTLCGDARDNCPVIPKGKTAIHWDLQDPAKAVGTEEEILNEFYKVRDQIKKEVQALNKEN